MGTPHFLQSHLKTLKHLKPLVVPYILFGLCVATVKHTPEPPPEAAVDISVYKSVVSRPVTKFPVDASLLRASAKTQNYDCLAAVHVGIPERVIVIGDAVLVNPAIQRQGSRLSRAYETNAFFMELPARLVSRFLPVTLKYQDAAGQPGVGLYDGSEGHCALGLLQQLEGRSIYD